MMSMNLDLNTTPALEPPDGLTSNFDDPFSIHTAQIAVSSTSLFLCTLFVVAHLYTRTVVVRTFGLTDIALLVSLASLAAYVALAIYGGQFGQDVHQWDVTLADFLELQQPLNVVEILYSPMVFGAKYAVLRQIETIFFDHRRKHVASRVIRGLIWANLVFYAAIMFVFIFACVPREKIWNPSLSGKCIDTTAAIVSSGTINLVSDLTILIVPVSAVLDLNIPLKKKIGVAAVFGVGILANVASAVKLYYSVKLTQTNDVTFAISHVGFASFAEITSIFLVACVPQFPRLVRHFRQRHTIQTDYPTAGIGRKKNSEYVQVEEGIQMSGSQIK